MMQRTLMRWAMGLCLWPMALFGHEGANESDIADLKEQIYQGSSEAELAPAVEALLAQGQQEDSLRVYFELGNAYRVVGERGLALHYLNLATQFEQKPQIMLGKAFLAKGLLLSAQSDYPAARRSYEDAVAVFEALRETGNLLSACYQNLGKLNVRLGAYAKAIELFEKDLLLGLSARDSITDLSELANVYQLEKDYQRAIDHYQQALSFPTIAVEQEATILANLAELHGERGEQALGLQHIQQAIERFEALRQVDEEAAHWYLYGAYLIRGSMALAAGTLDQAGEALDQAMAHAWAYFGDLPSREVGKIYFLKGKLALERQQARLALEHFQQALQSVLPDFQPGDELAHPPTASLYAENTLIDALVGKAEAFRALSEQQPEAARSLLEEALACYTLVQEVEDLFRYSYEYEHSKLILAEGNHVRAEAAIQTAHQLFELTREPGYLQQAFAFAERSKAWVLHELMRELAAKRQADIPSSLLAREQRLKRELAACEQALAQGGQTTEENVALQREKFTLRKELKAFVDSLETRYPAYFKAKYQFPLRTVGDIQQHLLLPDQALIEYFLGQEEMAYVFVITPQEVQMAALAHTDSLKQNVESFFHALQDPAQEQAYRVLGHRLYQQLVQPARQMVGTLPPRLLVVPDGSLGYIPFDALLTRQVEDRTSLKQLPYLIRAHSLSYAYSASLLGELKQLPAARGSQLFLGLAPEFGGSSEHARLAYSVEELEQIRETLGQGTLLVREEATPSQLIEHAGDYQVVHISSHAAVEDEDPLSSWIAFWEGADGRNRLTARELYGLSLNAELAVLGACQTGFGDVRQGEGIMSLARCFTFAGCKSLIMTLWEANHWSTHQIMEGLYRQLAQQLPKDQALRQAKLAYLESEQVDRQAAHPYYWAAAIPIGDMRALDWSQEPWEAYGLAIGLMLLGIGLVRWRIRQ